jgi:hypothetical protein
VESEPFGLSRLVKWTARRIPPPLPGYEPDVRYLPVIREKFFSVDTKDRERYNETVAEALAELIWEMCQEGWQPDDSAAPGEGPVRLVRLVPGDGD